MRRFFIFLLLSLILCAPGFPVSRHNSSRSSTSSSSERKKAVHVRSYTRKDGTVVRGYDRRTSGTASRIPRSYSPSGMGERGHTKRSESAGRAFMKGNPCPSTGKTSGACPGYVVDHIRPLAAGGPDDPSNMQWQTEAAAKEKDKWERK